MHRLPPETQKRSSGMHTMSKNMKGCFMGNIFWIRAISSNMVVTLWFQLQDMFQLIVTPQGIEKVTIQLKDTITRVYAMVLSCFYQRCS